MATLPKSDPAKITRQDAVDGLHNAIESFFDDKGLSERERDLRYSKLREQLDASDAETSNT
jgi:hypothetical protein